MDVVEAPKGTGAVLPGGGRDCTKQPLLLVPLPALDGACHEWKKAWERLSCRRSAKSDSTTGLQQRYASIPLVLDAKEPFAYILCSS